MFGLFVLLSGKTDSRICLVINASIVQSKYFLNLSNSSSIYSPECAIYVAHYEAVKISVKTTGIYTIVSSKVLVTRAAIYIDNFDPFRPLENRLMTVYQNCEDNRFRLIITLESDRTYILIVSTFFLTSLSALTVSVSGPNNIALNSIREYLERVIG